MFSISKCLAAIALVVLTTAAITSASMSRSHQSSLAELQIRLQSQYAAIEEEIAAPPARVNHPDDYRVVLRAWQDSLASRFSDAAATVEEIAKVDLANSAMWNERLETLRLYGKPISPPGERTVFGSGEVQKKAKILQAPAASYTDEARSKKVSGEVRLRLVFAADGTVKYVFPIKSFGYGLTESAMAAARQITFRPAERNDDQPVSQFVTLVYEFKKDNAKPYIPLTVF